MPGLSLSAQYPSGLFLWSPSLEDLDAWTDDHSSPLPNHEE
ncbi:MAG TPA: hypothetical protein VK463_15490 [Desulfomonilaceae bacterium]|nr:hypothetical protein [Desulfomonilaceae bacterium]